MESYTESTHPDVEQLTGYMESPESSQHNKIRKHLMACDQCRGRVDKLAQLEFDIKQYVPRFSKQSTLFDDDSNMEQNIGRFVDNQLDTKNSDIVKQQIDNNPESLKAALHYAVHSSAMRNNLSDTRSSNSARKDQTHSSSGSIISRMLKYLQLPAPVWAMAPATLLLAAIISLPLFYSQSVSQNTGPVIAKFQDNAVVSYSSADIPTGSIGFFHDAKSYDMPFSGINITINSNKGLNLDWPAIEKAKSYTLTVYSIEGDEKQEITSATTNQPLISLNNINWENRKHYQWQITGVTNDGLKFSTQGDFVLIKRNDD